MVKKKISLKRKKDLEEKQMDEYYDEWKSSDRRSLVEKYGQETIDAWKKSLKKLERIYKKRNF